jgi:hypothetical protein
MIGGHRRNPRAASADRCGRCCDVDLVEHIGIKERAVQGGSTLGLDHTSVWAQLRNSANCFAQVDFVVACS